MLLLLPVFFGQHGHGVRHQLQCLGDVLHVGGVDAAERLRDSMLGICAIPRVGLHPKKDPTIGPIVHVGADSLIREKSELTYAPHR